MIKDKQDKNGKPHSLHLDFTIEAGDFGTFDCCYKSDSIAEVFRNYFDSIFPGHPDRAEFASELMEEAADYGVTLDTLKRKHRELRDNAVELYTAHAIEFFTSKLGSAFKDVLIPLFMESALESYERLKRQEISVEKGIMVLPDVDRSGIARIALQLYEMMAKERLGIKRGGRKARFDLSNLRYIYENATLPNTKEAKSRYRENKDKLDWRERIKNGFPEMPDDLIERLPGKDAKLSARLQNKLERRGGLTSQPSEIALEWAARLCGAPPYNYRLDYLWGIRRSQGYNGQNKNRRQTKMSRNIRDSN